MNQEPHWCDFIGDVDEPQASPRLSPKEITALKTKIVDFIHDNDPFGDKISQHEILCISQYFADAAAARAEKIR